MKIFNKKRLLLISSTLLGSAVTITSVYAATAIGSQNTTVQLVRTATATVTYNDLKAAPALGSDTIVNLPSNTSLISAYAKVNTPFRINNDPNSNVSISFFAYDNPAAYDLGGADLTKVGVQTNRLNSYAFGPAVPIRYNLFAEDSNGDNNFNHFTSGKLTFYANYVINQ